MKRQVLFAGAKHTCSLDPDGWLRKTAKAEHMLRVPPAWAFDVAHIDAAQKAAVIGVEVFATDTGRVYRVDLASFLRHAFTVNRGYGAQVACELRHWTVTGPGMDAVDHTPAVADAQSAPLQLALW